MNAVPNLQVLVDKNLACVKIVGRANFNLSACFDTLLNELQRNNYRCYVMELAECLLMDSSFLGVLVGFAVKRNNDAASPSRIELHNPNPTVLRLFDDLGVLDLFEVTHGAAPVDSGEARAVNPGNSSKEDITRTCLEAHRNLMALNPDNARRFKDVARFLAEDLQKLQGGS